MTPHLWYYMCFHVATVLQELLALRVINVSDIILENAIQPCCSIAVNHTQCWVLIDALASHRKVKEIVMVIDMLCYDANAIYQHLKKFDRGKKIEVYGKI